MKYLLFNRVAAPLIGKTFVEAVEKGMAAIERCYNIGNAAGYKLTSMSAYNGYLGGDTSGVILEITATGSELVNGDTGPEKIYKVLLDGPTLVRPRAWSEIGGKFVATSEMTGDQLDAIMERTEYADQGVAIGDGAAADQDLRRVVQAEIGYRQFGEIA